mmetsp:Transcript_7762/g.17716  ORF Transcript_7762/g.17716 Transcript_7762/m.17716 type:complete len:158 (-) Transcript_7762:249-722(-)
MGFSGRMGRRLVGEDAELGEHLKWRADPASFSILNIFFYLLLLACALFLSYAACSAVLVRLTEGAWRFPVEVFAPCERLANWLTEMLETLNTLGTCLHERLCCLRRRLYAPMGADGAHKPNEATPGGKNESCTLKHCDAAAVASYQWMGMPELVDNL